MELVLKCSPACNWILIADLKDGKRAVQLLPHNLLAKVESPPWSPEMHQNFFCWLSTDDDLLSGKLVQIEYALQAVSSGAPSVGIKVISAYEIEIGMHTKSLSLLTMLIQAVNGCVLATEKKNKSILFEDHSTYKIEQVLNIYHASFTIFFASPAIA